MVRIMIVTAQVGAFRILHHPVAALNSYWIYSLEAHMEAIS